MSAHNRVVIMIVTLVVVGCATTTVLITVGAIAPEVIPIAWFEAQAQDIASASGGIQFATVAMAIVIAFVMLMLMRLNTANHHKSVCLLIGSTEEGAATITQDSVRVLAETVGRSIHNVSNMKCTVTEKDGKLLIKCNVLIAMGTNLPDLCNELRTCIRVTVQEFTGLPVLQVNMSAQYESPKAKRLSIR